MTELTKEQQRTIRWSSHVPINRALIDTNKINSVMELGAGLHSTPVFFELCDHVVSVENDAQWVKKVKETIKTTKEKNIFVHQLAGYIKVGTPFNKIQPIDLANQEQVWMGLLQSHMRMLFVDCFAGFRLHALQKLHHIFDFVVCHDVEPHEDKYYGYRYFKPNADYIHLIDKTFAAYTGIYIRRRFANYIPELFINHEKEVQKVSELYDFKFVPKLEQKL